MRLDVYHHFVDGACSCRVVDLLTVIQKEIKHMSDTLPAELTALTANVAALKTTADEAITLLNGISARIDAAVAAALAAGATQAQLAEMSALNTAVASETAALAAAVVAGTPAPVAQPGTI